MWPIKEIDFKAFLKRKVRIASCFLPQKKILIPAKVIEGPR